MAADQRDLQGFAPSSVEAACRPLRPLRTPPGGPLRAQLHNFTVKSGFQRT